MHNFISKLRFIALAVICTASLLVVIFMLPGIYAQICGNSNSSTLMQFQNPSLVRPEHIWKKVIKVDPKDHLGSVLLKNAGRKEKMNFLYQTFF